MGNKDLDKKRPRISSSGTDTESIEAAQDGAYIKMTLTEYQSFLLRLTAIEDNTKIREERILNLEARLDEAQVEIQALKKQLREVHKTVNNTKDSLEFTQGEHDDLVERVANCENEQSTCWDELTHLNIYSRRWNLIFYRVNESKDEDCFSLVRDVLTRNLNLPQDEVSNMKLCGAHRLGKPNRNRARPLIARFTCRADRDRVWKVRYRLKNSRISMSEDLPKHIQEIRKNVLIPAMKKIKQETPSHKASVIGDKLVVNGKVYFHYDVPKKWLPVNSSVNTHEDYGNGTAEHQEPLQSQEESSDVMVQSQALLSQSE